MLIDDTFMPPASVLDPGLSVSSSEFAGVPTLGAAALAIPLAALPVALLYARCHPTKAAA